MRLTISRADLGDLMNRGGASAPKITTIPVLSNVRLAAVGSTLRASTTDLDLQADAVISANVEAPGTVTVNASSLKTIVDRLPSGAELTLFVEKNDLIVKAGRTRARLPMLPADLFPSLDFDENGEAVSFSLSGSDLDRLFSRPSTAVAKDAARFYLEGVFLHVGGHAEPELRAVGTNGHIMIVTGVDLPEGVEQIPGPNGGRGAIVPSATVALALKLFRSEEEVGVTVSRSKIAFRGKATTLISKLIDGTYPDHERVIPKVSSNRISLDRASCTAALGILEAFMTGDSGNKIECGPDDEGLAMAAGAAEGDGFAVAVADFAGKVPNFGVSSRYLRTMLAAFGSEIVTLSIEDPGSPVRVFAEKEPRTVGVVMPMRVTTSLLAAERR
ncbi:DNA polymerase III subunit beta [Methylobacterium sp. WCS2018Hpa-22]|uniref:DNA polymerase III subunit beta n=1 Tax=Methylobacterium sp. WCS2018Hpa-22 TaxID=3073633 RepID=UPI00288B801A|nr:DNA polymerase III subunit beta [Methylobacterium sp. WCS2018Hpa-22]